MMLNVWGFQNVFLQLYLTIFAFVTCSMLSRPRRQAAIAAAENVRSILEWESLPEHSVKFQQVAAEFDKQFEDERQGKLVCAEDIDEDAASNFDDMCSEMEMSEEDEMDEDDMNFVEHDSNYEDSDATFILSGEESVASSCVDDEHINDSKGLTLEEELSDCMDVLINPDTMVGPVVHVHEAGGFIDMCQQSFVDDGGG